MMTKMVCKISGFNLRSIKKLSSGEILMGGLYGINRFRPDDIKYNKKRPSVMFTRLFLFNEEVGWVRNMKAG